MTTAADGVSLVIDINDRATRPIKTIESRFSSMKKRMMAGSAAIGRAFGRMRSAGQRMAARLNRSFMLVKLALAGIAIAAVVTGAKFQQAMANVASVAGASRETLEQLSLTARMWGEKTAFSASQAAEAMYALASAGQTAAQIQKSVGGVLLFAGAAATSLKESAEQTVQAIKMFGLAASDTNRVVNVFAAGISKSLLTADRLKESLAAVGSTAFAVGMSLEQTVSQIGLLHNAGMIGSIAGTRLKNVIVRLANPNKELQSILGNVSLETHTLAQVMDHLANSGMTAGQVFAAFGRIAAPAALVMMKNGAKVADEMTKAITGTNKVMDMYKIQMDTVMSRFKIFKSVVEENFIAVFMTIEPILSKVLDSLADKLRTAKAYIVGIVVTVRDWISANRDAVVEVLRFAAALGGVLVAFALLSSPVTWIIAAAALATAAWFKWSENIKRFLGVYRTRAVNAAETFLESHGQSFEGVLEIAKRTINGIIGTFVFLGRVFVRSAQMLFEVFSPSLNWLWNKFKWLVGGIVKIFRFLGESVAGALAQLTESSDEEVNAQWGLWGSFMKGIGEDATVAFGTDYVGAVVDASGKVISTIKSTAQAAAQELKKLRSTGLASGGGAVAAPEIKEAAGYEDYYEGMQAHAMAAVANIDNDIRSLDAALIQDQINADKRKYKAMVSNGMQYSDEWLALKRTMLSIEMELALSNADKTGLSEAQIKAAYRALEIEAEATHRDAKLEQQDEMIAKYVETHQLQMMMLDTMSAGYDTFFQTVLDLEMSGKKRREKMWASMKSRFISTIASMAKAYISHMIKAIIITSAAQKDANAKQRVEDAKLGAINAYRSMAGIPIVGPILGAIAAAAAFSFLMAFHKGGLVGGGARLGGNEQLAVVQDREFIVRREAVSAVGVPALEHINSTGRIPPSESGGSTVNLTIAYSGGGSGDEDALVEELEERIGPILEDIFERKRIVI